MQVLNEALLRVLAGWHSLQAGTKDESGQTLAEYALILAVIAMAVVITSVVAFRENIIAAFDSTTDCLDGSC